ncbi:MAG: MerR family transcriptional regulator [Bacteroidota bacterium]|nr:MerR family transcriptional regulator [Bacteroidota bacterium]
MTIGQLAKKTNVSIDTIRYYEQLKLLPKPKRNEKGYRIYTEDYRDKIEYILRSKELGFTLKEIREILTLKDCEDLFELTSLKIKEVDDKIKKYNQLIKKLKLLLRKCPSKGSIKHCSIMKSILKK